MSPICGVARIKLAMTDTDAKALSMLLASTFAAVTVSRELEAAGFKVSHQTVSRHRARYCSCG